MVYILGAGHISEEHAESVLKYFSENIDKLLRRLFSGHASFVKYLVTFNFNTKEWAVFDIEDVITFIKNQKLTITNRGILNFGKLLTMQKKGGNGVHIKIAKSHPDHPGNQLQFKLKPLSVTENVKPLSKWTI